mmetsp:Transcript_29911/g.45318  ORF Transcript_29911/g.45318 Transcript_29911/m.45318 type:complete len:254 (+) Transcript_29911:82-843(+)
MLRTILLRAVSIIFFTFPAYIYIERNGSLSLHSNKSRRQLRFFDPDHTTCGRDENDPRKLAHAFASATLYGATKEEVEEGYYLRRTISTMETIPEDLDEVDKIFKVLSYISRKLNRPIRVNKPVLLGYNSETMQAYSLVSSASLNSVGVKIVEEGYWNRAAQAQKVQKSIKDIALNQTDPVSVIEALRDDEKALEYGFYIDHLKDINLDTIGGLVGEEGGYINGEWTIQFSCGFEHPKPNAIRPANDKLAVLW